MKKNIDEENTSNNYSGYVLSIVVGSIASGIISGWEITSIGGLMAVLFFGGIISGIIYLFYKKQFQKIFTIVCVIISICAVLGASGVRLF